MSDASTLAIVRCLSGGHGLAAVLVRRAPTVTLDWDLRQRSRFEAADSSGRRLGIFLPRGSVVRGGDVLVAEDGTLVRVVAAEQPVMIVTHCADHGSAFDLLRAAYHLGNRHIALELQPDRLLLEPDHVLAGMLRRMHLVVREAQAPFEPEAGAYAGGHGHSHDHADANANADGHTHTHGHADARAHAHKHADGQADADSHPHGHDDAAGHHAPHETKPPFTPGSE